MLSAPTFPAASLRLSAALDPHMTWFSFGPVKNPTWKDFVIRVGGALAVMVIVILLTQEFFPGYEGIAVIVASGALTTFVAIQEARHNSAKKKAKQGSSRT